MKKERKIKSRYQKNYNFARKRFMKYVKGDSYYRYCSPHIINT